MTKKLCVSKWFGRTSNNITQICHGIYLAKKTHSYLQLPPNHSLLNTHDLDFTEGKAIQDVVNGGFFFIKEDLFGVSFIDWNTRRSILREYIRPMLPQELFPHESNDSLTIYIRSGDIFQRRTMRQVWEKAPNPLVGLRRILTDTDRVHSSFVQPPLAFYQKIIESKPWPRIIIVAQDMGNPVIQALLDKYDNVNFQIQKLEDDIKQLLSAQHLVIGYGTFGTTWALLSDFIQSLYSPVLPAKVFGYLYPGDISDIEVKTFECKDYIRVDKWKATPKQKKLMLNYSQDNILTMDSRQKL